MIPIARCYDDSTDRELIEIVALKRSNNMPGLQLVSALIDAAPGIKNTENVFVSSVAKALGAGNACDFGASLGIFFNQYLRPYIRFVSAHIIYIYIFSTKCSHFLS